VRLNREAIRLMPLAAELTIVVGCDAFLEEPGALDESHAIDVRLVRRATSRASRRTAEKNPWRDLSEPAAGRGATRTGASTWRFCAQVAAR
jgi:hypothetical protein